MRDRLLTAVTLSADQSPRSSLSLSDLNSPRQAPIRSLPGMRWRYRAVAAILLLLASGGYLWLARSGHRTTADLTQLSPVGNDIAPGGNKATLILAGGQSIILDSAFNGTLATQGSTQISKLSGGQLVYHAGTAPSETLYNTLSTPRGGQYKLMLPDGTAVLLNAASSIRYPTAFAGKERTVSITGEVYFEVARDKAHPFHVKFNAPSGEELEVLGTSFNINAYADDGNIRATLLEGMVKVSGSDAANVLLRPGQQARMAAAAAADHPQAIKVINNADIEQVMAWKNGLFNFNHAEIKTVLQQLARWYDIDIRYEGNLPTGTFQGKITRDLNLSQVLKLLQEVEVRFSIEGRTLIVKS
jgi:ferric-dicitrate binding protein FerR (iron transport regulator)